MVRLGEARQLTAGDWAAIRAVLGASRAPWVVNVAPGSHVGPVKWHANAYLAASVVRDDLRRGPLVDLEGVYEGNTRVWRDLGLGGTWAQIALPPDGLRDDFVASDRGRAFVVRGEFTDAELRAIVVAIRQYRPAPRDQLGPSLGALVGVSRSAPEEAEAQLEGHVFASLAIRDGVWAVVATRIVIA